MAQKADVRAIKRDDRYFLLIVVAVFAVAILVMGIWYATRDTSGSSTPKTMAANFILPGTEGTVSLTDFRGRYVLLNFWATWCPPCKAEMPGLNAYHQLHKNDGFSLVGINAGEDVATARAFMESNGFEFPVGVDVSMSLYTRYNVQALPSSYLIGPDGELIKAYPAGVVSPAQLERDITPLLNRS